jgi:hypothetical protein
MVSVSEMAASFESLANLRPICLLAQCFDHESVRGFIGGAGESCDSTLETFGKLEAGGRHG